MKEDIARALAVLRSGGVILYPTDTVWGIGCDATSSEAVRKVFEIKRRHESKALISLVGSEEMLERAIGRRMPQSVVDFIRKAPRPATVVYDDVKGLAPELLASDSSAGIRLTGEEYSSQLCLALGRPLVSTSANISGTPAPAIFSEIPQEIIDAVDYVARWRRDDTGRALPSMVVKASGDTMTILRP